MNNPMDNPIITQLRYQYEQGFLKSMPREQQRPAYKCFYHATGDITCKPNTFKYEINPSNYLQFDAFDRPNANYQPDAYLQNIDWYRTHGADKTKCCGQQYGNLSPPFTMDRVNQNNGK